LGNFALASGLATIIERVALPFGHLWYGEPNASNAIG
jgi:hypothetical protein